MKSGAASGGVEGEDRRTRIGKIMGATSLNELPQLFNVLVGDILFRERRIGRDGQPFDVLRLRLGVPLHQNWALRLDLKILVLTVATLFRRSEE